jgi:hypothetical protein
MSAPAPTATAVAHEVRFQRNTVTRLFKATCSCGWLLVGGQDEEQRIRALAGNHDAEWEPVT